MTGPEAVVTLPDAEPDRLAAAVSAALTASAETAAEFLTGAQQSAKEEPDDIAAARKFQTFLELGYLIASADGFAEQERASLAQLLEQVTDAAIDHEALELHFRDLDQAVEQLGRRERLARAAADLETPEAAEQAISIVATIAMADGCLSAAEYTVLIELGEHLKLGPHLIGPLVDRAAERVKKALR